ncbi:hypothetical protein CRE_17977 [Caenorhabditis remanei]|uniref:Uncharacterized protein n=1 Tax=Caenorhabditis remanei TaxID=31234 RepID=E3MDU7_CAERE|nr:hypothetical protein CRE_17977 [Caenorhabditis remanei]
MPPGLSYPALRCVLENLDAMKRLHITARSHSLKRIDKGIPLNIRSLNVEEQYTQKVNLFGNAITSIAIRIDSVSIFLYRQKLRFHVFGSRKQIWRREVPLWNTEKYLNYYLGEGRSKIFVNKLSIRLSRITPPAGVQLTINELDNIWSNFRIILPNINPDSFPLKMFTAYFSDSINFDHPIVHSSKYLVLSMNGTLAGTLLLSLGRLPNKAVLFNPNSWEHYEIVNIIKYWIENRKTIGTKYLFLYGAYKYILDILNKVSEEFSEIKTNLQEVDERGISKLSGVTIPINSQSKIYVYGVKKPNHLVVEVVSATELV